MLGLAMGMIPNRQVGLNKKGARRKNQNSEKHPSIPVQNNETAGCLGGADPGGLEAELF